MVGVGALLLSLSLSLAQEKKETVKTNYSLSDTVFAKAELKCDGRVCIWLGVSSVWSSDTPTKQFGQRCDSEGPQ